MYTCFVCICVYAPCAHSTGGGQTRASEPWNLKATIWKLGTQYGWVLYECSETLSQSSNHPPFTFNCKSLAKDLQICVCIGSHLHTCTCESKRPTPGIYFSCSPAHFLRWLTLGFTEPGSSSILLDWPANELRHLLVSPTSSTWSWKTCAAVGQLWHER